ncbi:transcription factor bHLH167-like [Impatiens glandulifera]|uniref:transcription factor bHLH167-like n=1 Tax=Impatiens glandulifera TaxID=253017 RepID=UPI001FB076F2|nr:transcription factor bHLH167-like [Impatiens glandulifera]
MDRKTVERNRRINMKSLFSKLTSLIPPDPHSHLSKVSHSQEEQIDRATAYINELSQNVAELKQTKERITRDKKAYVENSMSSILRPNIQLKESDSTLEVIIVSGMIRSFMLSQVIDILEDEGAEVVSANISTKGFNIFHIIHAQVKVCRIGVETSRIYQRLQQLIIT